MGQHQTQKPLCVKEKMQTQPKENAIMDIMNWRKYLQIIYFIKRLLTRNIYVYVISPTIQMKKSNNPIIT